MIKVWIAPLRQFAILVMTENRYLSILFVAARTLFHHYLFSSSAIARSAKWDEATKKRSFPSLRGAAATTQSRREAL
jgi:hypothetical protein